MDAGAEVAGVTIQLCMAFPRHALQTVEMGQATQIRASQDHAPELGGQYGNLQVCPWVVHACDAPPPHCPRRC